MHRRTRAIVLAVRHHGEHGGVVRALTREDGLQPGYVRGARGRALRPVLQPGNIVLGEWRARTDDQLPALTVELVHSYAPLHAEPLPAAAIDWIAAATAAALPEGQPYPALYDALAACLDAIEAAPAARGWTVALVRYELLLLAQLGFGLDLATCVVTGAGDAAYVSPRTGGAVSVAGAGDYAARLLPLPGFLRGEAAGADWPALLDGLALTGHFLSRHIFVDRRVDPMSARHRLVERLKRAVA